MIENFTAFVNTPYITLGILRGQHGRDGVRALPSAAAPH